MSGTFQRDRLPDPLAYFEGQGLRLVGGGKWRTTRCDFHGGSDSMRVNVQSGAWVCMAGCGAKGGDLLAYEMQRTGAGFLTAARALGSLADAARPHQDQPRRIGARDALEVIGQELRVRLVVVHDARAGITPNATDWARFVAAAGRLEAIAAEAGA
jgi:hypothetical protein